MFFLNSRNDSELSIRDQIANQGGIAKVFFFAVADFNTRLLSAS